MSRSQGVRGAHIVAASLIVGSAAAPAATAQQPTPRIVVGPNVHVSAANSGRMHYEITLAADPNDARQLVVCSMLHNTKDDTKHSIVYHSGDQGRTWKPTIEPARSVYDGDPACIYGNEHQAIFSTLSLHYESGAPNEMLVLRSPDGGATWQPPLSFPFIHGEWLAVERPTRKIL